MASSSAPPLSETNTESQPHSPPENSRVKTYSLPEGPIPDFDWKALRPAVPERKIDVSKRVEELRKYLGENTYPAHQKNIMAAIEMYNRKELPKPNTHCVYIQDGKLTELNVDCLQRTGLIWMEGYQFQLMQAHGHHHQPQPQQPSTVFGYNHALGGAEV